MTTIITEKFRQHNAEQFFESFSEVIANTTYYLFIGKSLPYTTGTTGGNDSSPPTPTDSVSGEFYNWDAMLMLKKFLQQMYHTLYQELTLQTQQSMICTMTQFHLQILQHLVHQVYMLVIFILLHLQIMYIKF